MMVITSELTDISSGSHILELQASDLFWGLNSNSDLRLDHSVQDIFWNYCVEGKMIKLTPTVAFDSQ